MKEQLLVAHSQTGYTGEGGHSSMPDEVVQSQENQPAQSVNRRQGREGQSPPKEQPKLATDVNVEELVKEALRTYVREEMEREAVKGLSKGKRVREETKPRVQEEKVSREPVDVKRYFPQTEVPGAMHEYVQEFCAEAQRAHPDAKSVYGLPTEFLAKKYLSLRKRAQQAGIADFDFLSPVQHELYRRGVLVDNLASAADRWKNRAGAVAGGAGAIDLSTITTDWARDIAQGWNEDIERDRGNDPEYIKQRVVDIQKLRDSDRTLSREDIKKILDNMHDWEVQATEAENSQRMARNQHDVSRDPTRAESHFKQEDLDAIIGDDPKERERIFNDLFAGVDAQPGLRFENSFSQFYQKPKVDGFIDHLRREGERLIRDGEIKKGEYFLRESQKYGFEYDMRQPIHDVNFAMLKNIDTENMAGFVGAFGTETADIVFEKTGVVAAMHFYEQALLKIREENGGYIPYDQVVADAETGAPGRVEKIAREMLEKAVKKGLIKNPSINDLGEPIDKNGDTQFDDKGEQRPNWKQELKPIFKMDTWEINRAMSFAKGMGILTGRFVEIAATSKLPKDAPLARFTTLYGQKVIASIAPFRHLIGKYDIEGEKNRFLAFSLDRGKAPWVYDELKKIDFTSMLGIANDEDEHKRFMGVLNPFNVGGLFSRTTWRISDDPTASLLGEMLHDDEEKKWIGTGIAIEKARGNLESHDSAKKKEAEDIVKDNLGKIKTRLPLQLFYNVESVQKKALATLGKDIKDPQLQEDLDDLALLQEAAVVDRKDELFTPDDDPPVRESIVKLIRAIQGAFDDHEKEKLIERLADPEEDPFVFGTTDIPHEKYKYGKPGGNAIQRRWLDILDANKATGALLGPYGLVANTPRFQNPHDIVKAMHPIYMAIANYDRGAAEEVMMRLGEGLMKFYSKDWIHRLPAGIGTIAGIGTGQDSFARHAFGRGAMAWDETTLNEFTRIMRAEGLISLEMQHELQGRAGGGGIAVGYDTVRTVAPYLAFAVLFFILTKSATEKKAY